MIRVAHVLRRYHARYWGGTESAVLGMARGLREHGFESEFWAPTLDEPVPPSEDPLKKNGFKVHRYRAFLPSLGLNHQQRESHIAIGGNIVSLELCKRLKAHNYPLIHSHALGRIGAIAAMAAHSTRSPLVLHIHGGYLDMNDSAQNSLEKNTGIDIGKPFGWWYYSRKLLDNSSLIITLNTNELYLIKQKHPNQLVLQIPNSLPDSIGSFKNKGQRKTAYRYALLCGRISPEKDVHSAIKIAELLIQKSMIDKLIIAGPINNPRYKQKLDQYIIKNNLKEKVVFKEPFINGSDALYALYSNATITLNSSISETFGLSILESLALGTPAVCLETSGAKDIAKQHKGCKVISRSSLGENHLHLSMEDLNQLTEYAEQDQYSIVEQYNERSIGQKHAQAYQQLLNGNPNE